MTGHGPDDLMAQLARWAAAERVGEAVTGRVRTRSLLEQAAAEATMSGLLVDLAESGSEISLGVRGTGPMTGRVVGVGTDLVVLERPGRGPVLVRRGAVTSVAPGPSATGATAPLRPGGGRVPALDLTMGAALDALGADGAPVTLRTPDQSFTGIVQSCGQDVVTLRLEGAQRRPVYVALDAVTCVEMR